MSNITIRKAAYSDRSCLLDMLDTSFNKLTERERFANKYPHLFNATRISNHTLAIVDNKIIGCVGIYEFPAMIRGNSIVAAGVGQVSTISEFRKSGVMSTLLNTAINNSPDVDLFYLYGDRTRYGRFGFSPGGSTFCARTCRRYAPQLTESDSFRKIDLERDFELLELAFTRQSLLIKQGREERLASLIASDMTGWTDGESFILLSHGGTKVVLSYGEHHRIAQLVAHQVANLPTSSDGNLTMLIDPSDNSSLLAARQLGANFYSHPTAMLKVGQLRPLLQSWCSNMEPLPDFPYSSCTIDGGASGRVRLTVLNHQIHVTPTEDEPDISLSGAALSEFIFGTLPSSFTYMNIPMDSIIHRILPINLHVNLCYSL